MDVLSTDLSIMLCQMTLLFQILMHFELSMCWLLVGEY